MKLTESIKEIKINFEMGDSSTERQFIEAHIKAGFKLLQLTKFKSL